MKALEKILIAVLAVLVLLLAGAYLLPAKWHVSRSVIIHAPPAKIHPLVESLKAWPTWAPWTTELDPTLKYEYAGPDTGVGAISSWTGDKTGPGTLRITESDPAKGVVFVMQFGDDHYKSHGSIRYEMVPDGTRVTWTSSGRLGNNPINRYFGLLMNSMIGADFEKGLAKLKKVSENGT